ncbi:hypothetical protein Bbelb_080130 [Branchiostoma belcheri]|nr:hypothetical protein Bbelb_080130 [Branchiostoma belcheri]
MAAAPGGREATGFDFDKWCLENSLHQKVVDYLRREEFTAPDLLAYFSEEDKERLRLDGVGYAHIRRLDAAIKTLQVPPSPHSKGQATGQLTPVAVVQLTPEAVEESAATPQNAILRTAPYSHCRLARYGLRKMALRPEPERNQVQPRWASFSKTLRTLAAKLTWPHKQTYPADRHAVRSPRYVEPSPRRSPGSAYPRTSRSRCCQRVESGPQHPFLSGSGTSWPAYVGRK